MKIFLYILVLIFSFQTLIKADDIRDFQIEGMSIGDSLLDYMTINEINSAKKNQTTMGDYTMIYYYYSPNTNKIYDFVQVAYLINDKNYKIHQISGFLNFSNKIKRCLKKKEEIEKDINQSFMNVKINKKENLAHPYDKTGNTKFWSTDHIFKTGGVVNVGCTDWSKKFETEKRWLDALDVNITSDTYWKYLTKFYN
jgi:hypothetical protein